MKKQMRLVIWPDWYGEERFWGGEPYIELAPVVADSHYQIPFSQANSFSESGQKDKANRLMEETLVWEVTVDTETGEIVRGKQIKEQWSNAHSVSWCEEHQCVDRCSYDREWSGFAWYRPED